MAKQIFNPYLPSWEYIPDGEPHVFDGRVYVFGSHDMFNGWVFCLGDYVCYSAPVDNLKDWRFEGVIYRRGDDPLNSDGSMVLYAPDVTRGPDGRYYLYYVLDKVPVVSVAVCDSPAGTYKFYGYVHYADGTRLGERKGDMPQFDPAVLTEDGRTYLYTGFCGNGMKDRVGAMATVLGADMLTIEQEPSVIVPGDLYSQAPHPAVEDCAYTLASEELWPGFKGHEFFEASSIRKIGSTYYFVYSSAVMHELCYAVSSSPTQGFSYGGVIVSNCDLHISSYKPADMPAAYGANNHGGIECIGGSWYIFYHRHTNGTWYCRQGCAEKIKILPDGSIPQVELSSCGLNGGPLEGSGFYPAYIACNLFTDKPSKYVDGSIYPRITQDGRDGDEEEGYVTGICDKTVIGFKYFSFTGVRKVAVTVRGYFSGCFEVRTAWDGELLGTIPVEFYNFWTERTAAVTVPDGVSALYLTFRGNGSGQLKGFRLG